MNTQDGGPAYPVQANDQYEGMSLRDHFAAAALTGCIEWVRLELVDALLSDGEAPYAQPVNLGTGLDDGKTARAIAASCYAMADAMLEERTKE